MPLATIYFKTGQMKQSGDRDAVLRAYAIWKGQVLDRDLKDTEKPYAHQIRRIVLPPSWAADVSGYEPASKPLDKTPLRLDVRGLDDIDTPPERKRDPTIPNADDWDRIYK